MSSRKKNLTDAQPSEAARNQAVASRTLGMAAFVALILWTITGETDLGTFLDSQGLAIAFLGPVALLIACFGLRGAKTAVVTLFGGSRSPRDTVDAVSFFRLGAAFSLACGFMGTLIGVVIMLKNMDDPSMIGPALAMALLTQLYGVLFAVLSMVCAAVVSRRQATAQSSAELEDLGKQSLAIGAPATAIGVLTVVVSCLVFGLSMFGMPS